jgi:hypothetical protein
VENYTDCRYGEGEEAAERYLQKGIITKNNQIFRQRMSTLSAENAQTEVGRGLDAAQKKSAAISEERDVLKVELLPCGRRFG